MPNRNLYQEAWTSSEGASLYEKARPGYAPAAVDFIISTFNIDSTSRVLDLAAGTGKLTRQLLGSGAQITAVEPLPGMRQAFAEALPAITVVEGTAEAIPLPAESVDLVTAGQAWHWFDSKAALAEVTRIVKLGGALTLLWNVYDQTEPWMREFAAIRKSGTDSTPWRDEEHWQQAFAASAAWQPLQLELFSHRSVTTRDGLVERMLSSSVMTVLPESEKANVREDILRVLDGHDETRGRKTIAVPYCTQVFWTVKLANA